MMAVAEKVRAVTRSGQAVLLTQRDCSKTSQAVLDAPNPLVHSCCTAWPATYSVAGSTYAQQRFEHDGH